MSVQADAFDPAALLAALTGSAGEVGAVVSFTGLVRRADGVEHLELQSYPGFTERQIEAEVVLTARHYGLLDLTVVHRTGRMAPGEAIVFVGAAASHRRSAFEAVDRLMDYLKTSAPFWKAEHSQSGSCWIEPRPQDHADAARWTA